MEENDVNQVASGLEHLQASSPVCNFAIPINPPGEHIIESLRSEVESTNTAVRSTSELGNTISDSPWAMQLDSTQPEYPLLPSDAYSTETEPLNLSYQKSPSGVNIIEQRNKRVGNKKRRVESSASAPKETPIDHPATQETTQKKSENGPTFRLSYDFIKGSGDEKDKQFPVLIHGILERWHSLFPEEDVAHPCAVGNPSLNNCKIFDKDAEEYKLLLWRVNKLCAGKQRHYHILVLESEKGDEEMVVKLKTRPTWKFSKQCKKLKGYYLLAWKEATTSFETTSSILCLWRTDTSTAEGLLTFIATISPPGDNTVFNYGVMDDHVPATSNARTYEAMIAVVRNPGKVIFDEALIREIVLGYRDQANPTPVATDSREIGRRRLAVRFKLVLHGGEAFRYFDTDNAAVFFQKIEESYNPVPAGVHCTYPGVEGVRFVGTQCHDEFDLCWRPSPVRAPALARRRWSL
ncbi:uncharacterized protein N7506_004779 [Penicillium brevicompactum]|uniref:uncharacterized protein n=1 Tax=Penicillium brevicompactum TaxID=5074 RepID=UPI002541F366|nr:uncharacterized protein N7506_004779 [Penicillium brevicompactum]KAJ5336757.1 hypothetical protein N7506_004779 [Penicillium brevicompactum]